MILGGQEFRQGVAGRFFLCCVMFKASTKINALSLTFSDRSLLSNEKSITTKISTEHYSVIRTLGKNKQLQIRVGNLHFCIGSNKLQLPMLTLQQLVK